MKIVSVFEIKALLGAIIKEKPSFRRFQEMLRYSDESKKLYLEIDLNNRSKFHVYVSKNLIIESIDFVNNPENQKPFKVSKSHFTLLSTFVGCQLDPSLLESVVKRGEKFIFTEEVVGYIENGKFKQRNLCKNILPEVYSIFESSIVKNAIVFNKSIIRKTDHVNLVETFNKLYNIYENLIESQNVKGSYEKSWEFVLKKGFKTVRVTLSKIYNYDLVIRFNDPKIGEFSHFKLGINQCSDTEMVQFVKEFLAEKPSLKFKTLMMGSLSLNFHKSNSYKYTEVSQDKSQVEICFKGSKNPIKTPLLFEVDFNIRKVTCLTPLKKSAHVYS